jgi:catechol 2,3-dioxygenase-like lactoylglutathione lyase family enzyme
MPHPIDHAVLTSRDLGAQEAFYRRLGFTVGSRNRHPWGTENHIVQFDGNFLELISTGAGATIPEHAPRHFSFGAFVRDSLAAREGFAMLALRSDDSTQDAVHFAKAGIGDFEPFPFERSAMRSDGTTATVAFTLAFARSDKMPAAGFFMCQHHFPENFWSPAMQRHANGATRISGVVIAAPAPQAHIPFLKHFTGVDPFEDVEEYVAFETGGEIEVLQSALLDPRFFTPDIGADTQLVACRIAVTDLEITRNCLKTARIPFHISDKKLVVPAQHAFGTALIFEPEGALTGQQPLRGN